VEQIVETKEGEVLAKDEAGTRYLLKDMIAGSECNPKSKEDTMASMELLAHFHLLCQGCPIEIPDFMKQEKGNLMVSYEKHYKELIKVRNYVKSRKRKNEFEMKFQEQYPNFMEYAKRSVEMLEDSDGDGLAYSLCHGDFNQHNVIRTRQGWRMIHFEYVNYNTPVMDIANFLRKMLEKNNWNEELGILLIQSYESVRPISREELRQLYILLLFPEKFWKIANHYYNSHKAWLSGRDIEKLDKIILQEEARCNFLQKLFSFLS
jgi:CotS family spore coat protein